MSLVIDLSQPDLVKITFMLHVGPDDGPVSVVGSFNDWIAGMDELVADGEGRRSVTVGVPYDETVVFRYLGAGGTWTDEPDADEITLEGSVVNGVAPAGR